MAKFDQKNDIKLSSALNLQTVSSDTTTVGNIIDMRGFEALTLAFQTGTVTDGDYAVLVEHGDDAALADAAAVADTALIGTEAEASFTADTDDNKVATIGYRGDKRYVRLSIVSTGTTTSAVLGAMAIQGHPTIKPVA